MLYKRTDVVYNKQLNMWSYFLDRLLYKNYSLDSRSLSLFRVCMGLILLVNFLVTRLPFFDLFHSEAGFFPFSSAANSREFFSKTTSLNFMYSGDGFQIFLFVLAILCAVFLLIGYRTKWALFGSWILLASLHAKNPLVINSGDNLLVLILFWSLLLPLNNHFSLDKVGEKNKAFNEFSIGTFALIGQILMVYIFTAALKTDPVWKNGSAVYYALMLDNFRTQWGDILLQYPAVMKVATHLTYYFFETSVPWLFVFFGWLWRARVILIFLMIGFHLSLGLFLKLGLFSWICIAVWLVLLPPEFWDRLDRYLPVNYKKIPVLGIKIRALVSNSKALLGKLSFFDWKRKTDSSMVFSSGFNKNIFKILSVFFGLCFLYSVAWNIRATNFTKYARYFSTSWNGPGQFFHLHQYWAMFSPKPAVKGGWIILSATKKESKLDSKSESKIETFNKVESVPVKIDLWQGGKLVNMEKPHEYSDTFPGFRHRKLIENLIFKSKGKPHLKKYLQYWCRKWNKKHPENEIKDIEFVYMEVITPPPDGQPRQPALRSLKKVKCRK